MKLFESEVHEGTLIQGLDCLQTWFSKSACHEVPPIFIQWIPKGLALKSVTSNVRTGYFQCLLEALLNSTGSNGGTNSELLKSILKILDNASRQPAQVAIVTEAIHCCACYFKLYPDEVEKNNNEVMKVSSDVAPFIISSF